jgi:hypothetical protein
MATLSITTDVKKAQLLLPGSNKCGWKWLFLRAVLGKCISGRYSMDITLLYKGGNVVVYIGRRTELVLGDERRTAEFAKCKDVLKGIELEFSGR